VCHKSLPKETDSNMDFGCIRISKELEKKLNLAMKNKVMVNKKFYTLKEYIPALLESVVEEAD
tara:strand:- start:184 stop:372 length:189 start_codon:yes stop_codon:yes gene_type:complete